jgi:uracil-DNA glycosylase
MSTVAPDWPKTLPARVALVGEAPAETETLLGRPFVGRAGKLLNGALHQIGLSRWDCLVTNTFASRLPKDDVANLGISRKEAHALLREWEHEQDADHPFKQHCLTPVAKGAYLEPGRVADELSRLRDELNHADPNIVVVLGGTACWGLLGLPGAGTVSRIRGALTHEVLTGRKAIATYHPAAVSRNPKLREFLLSDLARAKAECDSPTLSLEERHLLIPETPWEVRQFLLHKCIANGTPVAVDIETTRGQIDCIGFAPSRTLAMCVPIFHPKHPGLHYWPTPEAELEVINHIAFFMESPVPKIFQYGQYDVPWIFERWGISTFGPYDDTRLMMHALNPEQDKDLASIGGTFERLGPWKMMRKAATSGKRDD